MAFETGTWIWAKCLSASQIWWPGKIVDISSMPKSLDYYKERIKNPIACVHFEREGTYELVTNKNKICKYECSNKLEYVKKGYLLFVQQQKRGKITVGFNMENFIKDVNDVERAIGGDLNIFEQFKQNDESPRRPTININELFVTEKERKKRKRQSLKILKKPQSKSKANSKKKPSSRPFPLFLTEQTKKPKTLYCLYCPSFSSSLVHNLRTHMNSCKLKNVQRPLKNEKNTKHNPKETKSSRSSVPRGYASVSVTSNRFKKEQKILKSDADKKRKFIGKAKSYAKKVKLQAEPLKDMEDADDNNTVQNTIQNTVPHTNEDEEPNSEVRNSEVKKSTPISDFDSDENADNGPSSTNRDSLSTVSTDPTIGISLDNILNENQHEKNKSHETSDLIDDSPDDTQLKNIPSSSTQDVQTESNVESFLNCTNQESLNDHSKSAKNLDSMAIASFSKIIENSIKEFDLKKSGENMTHEISDLVDVQIPSSSTQNVHNESNIEKLFDDSCSNTIIATTKIASNENINSYETDSVVNMENNDIKVNKVHTEYGQIDFLNTNVPERDLVQPSGDNPDSNYGINKENSNIGIVDFMEKLQLNEYPKIVQNNYEKDITTDLAPPIVDDVEEHPNKTRCLYLYYEEKPQTISDEELVNSEAFKKFKRIIELGGEVTITEIHTNYHIEEAFE